MIYNPMRQGREKIAIALSKDKGLTFFVEKIIEIVPSGELSYPSIIQSKDGCIHISYTYKRETVKYMLIDENWIFGGKVVCYL